MSDMGLPAESQASKAPRSFMDGAMTVAISMTATALVALLVFWGWSWWSSTKVETTSSPALRTIDQLKVEVAKHPSNAAVRVRLAEALATAGLSDEALGQLKTAVQLDAKHTGAWLDMGTIAYQKGKYADATNYMKKVVTLTEGSTMEDVNQRRESALFGLAQIALNQKRYDDALGYIKGALRIRRDASDSYLILAKAYKGNGDNAKALANLKIALSFDPNLGEANYELGLIMKSQGQMQEAAVALRKAADAAPKNPAPAKALAEMGPASKWVTAAKAKVAAKDMKGARRDYETALAIEPGSVPTALAYATLLEQLGKKDSAVQAYQQVLQEDPSNAAAKAAVARLTAATKK